MRWTTLVTPLGTGFPNLILLLTTMLPFLKLRISKFLKLFRLDWRYGTSCEMMTVVSEEHGELLRTMNRFVSSHQLKEPLLQGLVLIRALVEKVHGEGHVGHSEAEEDRQGSARARWQCQGFQL